MREIPHSPVALYEVAHLFGTLVAETILASVHVRARKQAEHMGASDLIKALQNILRGGGRPHMGNPGLEVCGAVEPRFWHLVAWIWQESSSIRHLWCVRRSWRVPAGGRPARVRP